MLSKGHLLNITSWPYVLLPYEITLLLKCKAYVYCKAHLPYALIQSTFAAQWGQALFRDLGSRRSTWPRSCKCHAPQSEPQELITLSDMLRLPCLLVPSEEPGSVYWMPAGLGLTHRVNTERDPIPDGALWALRRGCVCGWVGVGVGWWGLLVVPPVLKPVSAYPCLGLGDTVLWPICTSSAGVNAHPDLDRRHTRVLRPCCLTELSSWLEGEDMGKRLPFSISCRSRQWKQTGWLWRWDLLKHSWLLLACSGKWRVLCM